MKSMYPVLLTAAMLWFRPEVQAQALFTQPDALLFTGSSSGTPQSPETATPSLYFDGHVINQGTITNQGEIQFRGNLTNTGTFSAGGDEVFNGTGLQSLSGNFTASNAFQNLLIDKPAQSILEANAHVEVDSTGLLKFTGGGIIRMNSTHELRILNGAAVALQGYPVPNATGIYTNDKYIIGRLARAFTSAGQVRDFPVGDHFSSGEGYNPIVLSVQSLSAPDLLVSRFQKGNAGTINTGGPIPVGCGTPASADFSAFTGEGYWEIFQKGGSSVTYNVSMHCNSGNLNGNPSAPYYRVLRNSSVGGSWPLSAVTDGDECTVSSNYFQVPGNGYSGFSFFAIAPCNPAAVFWLGGGNSDWQTGSNWSNGLVPGCGVNISIPTGNTPYPVINVPASCGNLALGSGVDLLLNASLSVCGNWSGAGKVSGPGAVVFNRSAPGDQLISGSTEFNRLTIARTSGRWVRTRLNTSDIRIKTVLNLQSGKFSTTANPVKLLSDSSGTAYVDDFSFGNSGTLVGSLKMQRYAAGTGNGPTTQHQISTGLSGVGISGSLGSLLNLNSPNAQMVIPNAGCTGLQSGSPYANLMQWIPAAVNSCMLEGYQTRTSGFTQQGTGYVANIPDNAVLEYRGTYTAGNISISTVNTGNSVQNGYNLIGNPYASAVTYTAQPGFDANGLIFIPNGDYSGTYQPLPPGSPVASSQGFWVRLNTPGTAFYQFTNHMRLPGNPLWYKSIHDQQVSFEVKAGTYKDLTTIAFSPDAGENWDSEFDAGKLISINEQPTLFTLASNLPASLNVIKNAEETPSVPMGVCYPSGGSVEIAVKELMIPDNYELLLEDKATGLWHNFKKDPVFRYEEKGNTSLKETRFEIHFKKEEQVEKIKIYSYGQTVYVDFNRLASPDAIIEIYNILGQKLTEGSMKNRGIWKFTFTGTEPFYAVVKVNNLGAIQSQKVLIDLNE